MKMPLSHSTVGRLVVLAMLITLNWSCTPAPLANCDAFQVSALRAMVGELSSSEQVTTRAIEAYSLSEEAITEYQEAMPNLERVSWNVRGQEYSALFSDGVLQKINLFFHGTRITVDDFLACFGQPGSYRAIYRWDSETRVLELSLYYPQQGLIASAFVFSRTNAAPPIDGRVTIDGLVVTRPGEISQLEASSYTYPQSPDTINATLQQIRPWPGSVDLIIVDNQTME